MSKKITDNTTKATAAAADWVLINDVSASTDKKTTVGGLATAVAANIPSNSLAFAQLLSTIFSGQVTTYTNPGSAGGTSSFFYVNLGGIKLLWGVTGNISTGSSGVVTYPVGFFSTVQVAIPALKSVSGTNALNAPYLSSDTAAGATVNLVATAGSGSMPSNSW